MPRVKQTSSPVEKKVEIPDTSDEESSLTGSETESDDDLLDVIEVKHDRDLKPQAPPPRSRPVQRKPAPQSRPAETKRDRGMEVTVQKEVEYDSDSSDSDSASDSDQEWWEQESLIDDLLDSIEDMSDTAAVENEEGLPLTDKEVLAYRNRLKRMDPTEWLEIMLRKGYTKVQILRVMGVKMKDFLEQLPDRALDIFIEKAIRKESKKRRKLKHVNTIDDVCEAIRRAKNILVITGAGISTSLGIPDFRSPQNGLYSRLKHLGLDDPQDVFDIHTFEDDPTIFYSVAKDIIPSEKRFTPTHAFIALLQKHDKLLTNYTQNIDNIESYAGIHPSKLIQCHGSFATATCRKPSCQYQCPGENIFPEMRRGQVPRCPRCQEKSLREAKAGKKRKRGRGSDGPRKQKFSEDASADEEESSFYSAGVMKPDITFFGERLPEHFFDRLFESDLQKADMLLCIGTSLKVAPVCKIPGHLPRHVPQVMISKTDIDENFDVKLMGGCDDVVTELARRLGWDLTHEMIADDWSVQIRPVKPDLDGEGDAGERFGDEDDDPPHIWEFVRE